ncbi:MAG: ASCH domain-containing protein [Thermococcus sp.]|uniref:ASCH domain-containing protein n=1 Tax=Thermococcus sp. TaxID=35749 RepID=UPI001DE53BE6|nr:ASCH domain-containing protein [Thermococcus sp.]MBO8175667.1 ASCH domain-containing protein [Thermococcus sp.]
MKNLKFDGRYKDMIISGKKRATIRLGRKINLKPGDEVLIHSGGYVLGKGVVKRVETKKVSELTDEDARLDGFKNKEELLKALKEHYRRLTPETPATIIEFEITKLLDKPILSADFPYEGNNPIEIAEKALKYLDNLSFEEIALLNLFLKEGSLRKAAYKLGGLNKRYKIREVLRKAYEELKKKGLMGPKI